MKINYKIINKRKFMKKLDLILDEFDIFRMFSQTTKHRLRAKIRMELII